MTIKRILPLLLLTTFFNSSLMAENYGFAQSEKDITEMLGGTVNRGEARSNWGTKGIPLPQEKRTYKVLRLRGDKLIGDTQARGFIAESDEETTRPSDCAANLKIEFDYNSYAIRTESYQLLDKLGRALNSDTLQGKQVLINGHTDADGSEAYNLELSVDRAAAMKRYLTNHHQIDYDTLEVVGYGEGMPLVDNSSRANKQLNRRVEVQMEKCGS